MDKDKSKNLVYHFVNMNQIPTLVLGIGGVGCKIAAAVSDSLSSKDRKYVSVIGIDTNIQDLSQLREKHQMEIIQTSDEMEVSTYLEKHPEYCDWFPDNDFLQQRTMTDGAGQIRTLSRMAFLASVENGRFAPILQEINRIRVVGENEVSSNLTVIVVGSITGGTGAGLFLNIPFYIRNLIKTQSSIRNCIIRGMFVGPDIMETVNPSPTNKAAICVNGYSCLKELNAFYMRPTMGKKIANNLRLEYYDHTDTSANNVPYNYLYIIEKSGKTGTMGEAYIDEIIKYIAHIVFTLMFSPVTKDARSVEDNFILALIGEGGMNRYAGAGMCKLVYPRDTVQEYVTYYVVKELVKNEWLLIDRQYNALAKAAVSRMNADPTAEKPEIKKSYVEIFRKEVLGDHAKLGKLAKEAFVEQPDGEYVSIATEFIAALDRMVDDLLESDEIKAKEEACKIDDQKMKSYSDAEGQINDVWENMRKYGKYAKNLINTKPGGFADDLFPISEDVMEFHKDKQDCIYRFLAKVHPVTARFLIYDIINKLEEKMAELKNDIMGVDLSAYTQEDFDPKVEGNQGPSEALAKIRDNRHPIWRMLGPIGKAVNSEEKTLIKLKRRLHEVCDSHISTTHDFLENSLKYQISQLVLERMTALADNYTVFFNSVADKIEQNNDSISRLESIRFPFGQEGIYCSEAALKKMATEFMSTQSQELSDETKAAIFEKIYHVQSRSFTASSVADTQAAKERRIEEDRRQLESVFNNAVVNTVRTSVIKKGGSIINLSARDAIKKEFELLTDMIPDDPDYKETVSNYVKQRIERAMKVADPMLATEGGQEDTVLTFLAVSPMCAETDKEMNPDTSTTAKFYLSNTSDHTTVIINEEFKDTEITCMRLKYNFTIENLTKYRDDSRNAIMYNERIMSLGVKRTFNLNSEEMIVVVNPHLDTNWSEEGFIPSLQGKKRKQDHLDTLKAFVYGMGLDSFKRIDDDDHPDAKGNPRPTWYAYTNNYTEAHPIQKCGKLIGNGYTDVFDSIVYNRMLKLAILRDAKNATEAMKGYSTTEELFEGILENWFIEDLIHPDESKKPGDMNILDIFLEMRSHMPVEEWNELFTGLLITLWEFCEILFNKNDVIINRAVKMILTEIYKNCYVGKKPQDNLPMSERMLKDQFNTLMNQTYVPGK